MIRQIHIQNYKALRDVTLDLTPFHVLIGPNDSGKTSILEAVAALCRSVDKQTDELFVGKCQGRDLVWNGDEGVMPVQISADIADAKANDASVSDWGQYILKCAFQPKATNCSIQVSIRPPGKKPVELSVAPIEVGGLANSPATTEMKSAVKWAQTAISGAAYYRFNPRRLALPVAYDPQRNVQMDPSGLGLPICLDDMLGNDHSAFELLETRLKTIFPQIKQIKLRRAITTVDDPETIAPGPVPPTAWGKEICISFSNSPTPVPASQVSDGILLALAYLTVLHSSQSPRALLVEEPETGIYPRLLQKILAILRDAVKEQEHSQVIMTTHSPYVLDEFKPEEVTLCRKEPDRSISVHPLSKSKTVQSQLDIFSLGEIWTSEDDESLAAADEPAKEPAQ